MSQPAWYLRLEPRPAARVRLYCLPYAGGSASLYRQWQAYLPSWVDVRPVRLPGRPGRHRELPLTDCHDAARWLAGVLAAEPPDGLPFAVFGHSMGALLGYTLTRLLEREGGTLPALLALSGWPVRGVAHETMPGPDESDQQFIERLKWIGGIPQEILDDPAALALTVPIVRADFRLCRSYAFRPEPPLPVPLVVFGGTEDTVAPPHTLDEWRHQSADFRGQRLFRGGHFFLHDQVPALTTAVTATLTEVVGSPGRAYAVGASG